MPVNTEGFAELVGQIEKMAHRLNTDEEGAPTAKRILQAAAQPIHQQMKANASHDPKIITGKLHGAINIGKVKRRRNGGQNITIGVHRKDWDETEYVPAYVEYGHGGPAAAPGHPPIRPTHYNPQNEEHGTTRDGLLNEIIQLGFCHGSYCFSDCILDHRSEKRGRRAADVGHRNGVHLRHSAGGRWRDRSDHHP